MKKMILAVCLCALALPVWAGSLVLTWTDTADTEAGFHVERKLDGEADFSTIASPGMNAETYVDTTVPFNVLATYRVRAWNSGGVSDWSNEATAQNVMGPAGDMLALTVTSVEVPDVTHPYALWVSTSADRSNPVLLDGMTFGGVQYIYTFPDTGVTQVRFFLNNTNRTPPATKTEGIGPFDFAGSVGELGTNALPFDSSTLTNGVHTLSVEVDADGETHVTNSMFTVSN